MIEAFSNEVILAVYVQPKASKTEFVGIHGEALKFRVAAPPVEGEANAALCRHLAKLFSIPQRDVSIFSGQSSRRKRVSLLGIKESDVRTILNLAKA